MSDIVDPFAQKFPASDETPGATTPEETEEIAESLPDLMKASDLLPEPEEPADLGFEPGNKYMGFQIVDSREPADPAHAYLFDPKTAPGGVRAFYVASPQGTIGLVPWPGSTPIWPQEAAWAQDLYHANAAPEKQAAQKAFIDAYAKKQKEKEKK